MPSPSAPPVVVAQYERSGLLEGVHLGHAVVVAPDGSVVRAWGDPERITYPRSSNKPAQASAMVASGLDLPAPLLALVASSHSGEPMHLAGVAELLGRAGLDETALGTPPDWPLDPQERDAWVREGRAPAPVAMNCSGKHAGMLLTCVVAGWPTTGYLDPGHPLQQAITTHVSALAGEPIAHEGVDGCGAPLLALTLAGLARSFGRLALAEPDEPAGRVAAAMRADPDMAAGTRRDVARFVRAVPGLVAKDGAAGVYGAALPDGTGIALKVEDGSDAARQVAFAAILRALGVDSPEVDALGAIPLTGGTGVVGALTSPLA